jgi:cytochrome c oxidase subunit 2
MAIAIVVAVLMVGSVLFHLLTPWYLTPIASNWQSIDTALDVTFWVCGAVFVAVNSFMIWCVWKFRADRGGKADYEPENAKLEKHLTLWTAVGIAALLAPGLYAWALFVEVPANAAVVEAIGTQWQWTYRFPGRDNILGATEIRFVNDQNPFGVNPDDPYGRDDVLVQDSEVHLPIGAPIKMVLRSNDVLHDFFVPEFRARMNLVPGLTTYFWFTPTREGTFEVLCAQLCGVGHYAMRGTVVIDNRETFDAWLGQQPTFAPLAASLQ